MTDQRPNSTRPGNRGTNNMTRTTFLATCLLLVLAASDAQAHHSVLNYDGKVTVQISGTVTSARFGYPHSIYRIDVVNDAGETEKWVLSTEDPRDAERLGFADELKAIKRGDQISVVGWPDKFKERTIRGHQLLYPDGSVVMMRRGNYIWPRDILRLDRFVMNPDNIAQYLDDVDPALPDIEQVVAWIEENDHIARAAFEVTRDRPRLIGLRQDGQVEFPGIQELLACHARKPGFTMQLALNDISDAQREAIENEKGAGYINDYNASLARWWEQERESCE